MRGMLLRKCGTGRPYRFGPVSFASSPLCSTPQRHFSSFGASRALTVRHLGARTLRQYAGQQSSSKGPQEKTPRELSDCQWSTATVVENKAVSADGTLRTLIISVEDKVVYLEGRSMHRKQERPRWADSYKVPGQFVAIKFGNSEADVPQASSSAAESADWPQLYAIASSPYAVRRDSADLDASIIEILVDRQGSRHDQTLAGLGPGELLEVSTVLGRGYASLFNSYVGLLSALEDSRNLCLIGAGCRGIAPLRAVLEWTPVQAHSTAHRVTLLYACEAATSAAFIKDWDSWREAGVVVHPLYSEQWASGNGSTDTSGKLQAQLLNALYAHEKGLEGTFGGNPSDAAVLMSGMPGSVAAALSRELTGSGVERERVLFCDFF